MQKYQHVTFTHMLYADAVRGFDSTGMFLVNKHGNVEWMKSARNPVTLIAQKTYQDLMTAAFKDGQIMIGHNRKATTGDIKDENAHPFVEDNVILVHNGAIFGHKKHANTDVDSHAMAHLIKDKGNIPALQEIDGAYAFIWYDINTKTLFMSRNDKRPLWITETDEEWYISSEKELTDWMISRLDSYNKKGVKQPWQLQPGRLYSYKIGDDKIFYEEVPKKATNFPLQNFKQKQKTSLVVVSNSKEAPQKEASFLTKSLKGAFPYAKDQLISFEIDAVYKDTGMLDQYVLTGVDMENEWGMVSCNLTRLEKEKAEAWKFGTGRIASVEPCKTNPGHYNITLTPFSLTVGWQATTKNSIAIGPSLWARLPHQCFRCKCEVDYWEIDDCIVHVKKNNRHKVICPSCVAELEIVKEAHTKQEEHIFSHVTH